MERKEQKIDDSKSQKILFDIQIGEAKEQAAKRSVDVLDKCSTDFSCAKERQKKLLVLQLLALLPKDDVIAFVQNQFSNRPPLATKKEALEYLAKDGYVTYSNGYNIIEILRNNTAIQRIPHALSLFNSATQEVQNRENEEKNAKDQNIKSNYQIASINDLLECQRRIAQIAASSNVPDAIITPRIVELVNLPDNSNHVPGDDVKDAKVQKVSSISWISHVIALEGNPKKRAKMLEFFHKFMPEEAMVVKSNGEVSFDFSKVDLSDPINAEYSNAIKEAYAKFRGDGYDSQENGGISFSDISDFRKFTYGVSQITNLNGKDSEEKNEREASRVIRNYKKNRNAKGHFGRAYVDDMSIVRHIDNLDKLSSKRDYKFGNKAYDDVIDSALDRKKRKIWERVKNTRGEDAPGHPGFRTIEAMYAEYNHQLLRALAAKYIGISEAKADNSVVPAITQDDINADLAVTLDQIREIIRGRRVDSKDGVDFKEGGKDFLIPYVDAVLRSSAEDLGNNANHQKFVDNLSKFLDARTPTTSQSSALSNNQQSQNQPIGITLPQWKQRVGKEGNYVPFIIGSPVKKKTIKRGNTTVSVQDHNGIEDDIMTTFVYHGDSGYHALNAQVRMSAADTRYRWNDDGTYEGTNVREQVSICRIDDFPEVGGSQYCVVVSSKEYGVMKETISAQKIAEIRDEYLQKLADDESDNRYTILETLDASIKADAELVAVSRFLSGKASIVGGTTFEERDKSIRDAIANDIEAIQGEIENLFGEERKKLELILGATKRIEGIVNKFLRKKGVELETSGENPDIDELYFEISKEICDVDKKKHTKIDHVIQSLDNETKAANARLEGDAASSKKGSIFAYNQLVKDISDEKDISDSLLEAQEFINGTSDAVSMLHPYSSARKKFETENQKLADVVSNSPHQQEIRIQNIRRVMDRKISAQISDAIVKTQVQVDFTDSERYDIAASITRESRSNGVISASVDYLRRKLITSHETAEERRGEDKKSAQEFDDLGTQADNDAKDALSRADLIDRSTRDGKLRYAATMGEYFALQAKRLVYKSGNLASIVDPKLSSIDDKAGPTANILKTAGAKMKPSFTSSGVSWGADDNGVSTVMFTDGDHDILYLEIPGTPANIAVRVCRADGDVAYWKDGKPAVKSCKKGDIVIDENTICSRNEISGKWNYARVHQVGAKNAAKGALNAAFNLVSNAVTIGADYYNLGYHEIDNTSGQIAKIMGSHQYDEVIRQQYDKMKIKAMSSLDGVQHHIATMCSEDGKKGSRPFVSSSIALTPKVMFIEGQEMSDADGSHHDYSSKLQYPCLQSIGDKVSLHLEVKPNASSGDIQRNGVHIKVKNPLGHFEYKQCVNADALEEALKKSGGLDNIDGKDVDAAAKKIAGEVFEKIKKEKVAIGKKVGSEMEYTYRSYDDGSPSSKKPRRVSTTPDPIVSPRSYDRLIGHQIGSEIMVH